MPYRPHVQDALEAPLRRLGHPQLDAGPRPGHVDADLVPDGPVEPGDAAREGLAHELGVLGALAGEGRGASRERGGEVALRARAAARGGARGRRRTRQSCSRRRRRALKRRERGTHEEQLPDHGPQLVRDAAPRELPQLAEVDVVALEHVEELLPAALVAPALALVVRVGRRRVKLDDRRVGRREGGRVELDVAPGRVVVVVVRVGAVRVGRGVDDGRDRGAVGGGRGRGGRRWWRSEPGGLEALEDVCRVCAREGCSGQSRSTCRRREVRRRCRTHL